MSYHANLKLSLNTNLPRSEAKLSTPARRKAPSTFSPLSPAFSSTSSSASSAFPSSSIPQDSANLPLLPIDSEIFPSIIDNPFDNKPNMYKVPGQNVFFVPYNSAPMGSHPGWTPAAPAPAAPYQPFPESNYYPGQPRQYFEDINGGTRAQLYVVPRPGYESDANEDDEMRPTYASDSDKRARRISRSFPDATAFIESRPYTEKRPAFRPPLSVSPANSSATDDSGRSSSYSSTGSGRSVRWHDDLVAPTPPPSQPRPKGWFNRRGDQLWCNDGRYKAAIQEYPHHLRDYPDVGDGWMNEHGIRISMTHRRMPDVSARAPKGVLKNNISPLTF